MPIPDKFHRDLQKLIQKANPQSEEELRQLLNSLMGKPLPEMADEDKTPEDRALDLVDEAWQSSKTKGRELANEALEIWPDCLPAYEYLGNSYTTREKRVAYFEKGVAIGQRVFGGKFLKENKGHFWGITETRSYMRCLNELALTHQAAGRVQGAADIWKEMLELNPGDNQGIRYELLPVLLELGDVQSFKKYRKKYPEDGTMMYFNDALARFTEQGGTKESNLILRAAIGNNKFVPPLLLADAPPTESPSSYTLHSREEALVYAHSAWKVWAGTTGAKEWLKKQWAKEKPAGPAYPLTEEADDFNTPLFRRMDEGDLKSLIFQPLTSLSPLQLRPGLKAEDVKDVKMLQFIKQFLFDLQAVQPLKLTQKGNLPRKFVRQLYDHRIFTSKYIDEGKMKLLKEEDFGPIHLSHVLCKLGKLVSKYKGKLSLSKTGTKIFQDDAALYLALFDVFVSKFNWAYPVSFNPENVGQFGWPYSMMLFLIYGGEERPSNFYASQYLELFPEMMDEFPHNEYFSAEKRFLSCFHGRFFSKFCDFFGLVETRAEMDGHNLPKEYFVKKSALADKVFQLVNFSSVFQAN